MVKEIPQNTDEMGDSELSKTLKLIRDSRLRNAVRGLFEFWKHHPDFIKPYSKGNIPLDIQVSGKEVYALNQDMDENTRKVMWFLRTRGGEFGPYKSPYKYVLRIGHNEWLNECLGLLDVTSIVSFEMDSSGKQAPYIEFCRDLAKLMHDHCFFLQVQK